MTDQPVQPEQPDTPQVPPSDGTQITEPVQPTIPYDRFKQVNDERKALKDRLEALEQADADRKRKEQEEQGKFQQLYEESRTKAQRAEALEATLKSYLDVEIEAVPAEMRGLITKVGGIEQQLEFIAEAKRTGLFDKPKHPPTSAGTPGDPKPPSDRKLTPEQQELEAMARQYGFLRRGGNS
jgi:hypothetical protein